MKPSKVQNRQRSGRDRSLNYEVPFGALRLVNVPEPPKYLVKTSSLSDHLALVKYLIGYFSYLSRGLAKFRASNYQKVGRVS